MAPMHDEPDANAMPAASPRRQIGQGAVVLAVGRRDNRSAAEMEITVPRVTERPAARPWRERAELFGSRQARVSEGGYLGARRGGLVRRRLGGRLVFGIAVGPDGARDGDLFDLFNRHRFHGHEAAHKGDGAGDAARAILPAPDAPRADSEYPGGMAWREAKRAECRAEFSRGR